MTRLRLIDGAFHLDEKPCFLFGGELQYHRLRDPDFDVERTHALWQRALRKTRELGCNLVTTYVPWDYHERTKGVFDFSGVRDVRRFVQMASALNLQVMIKPGPFVMAEWPFGFGSFGGVPDWFIEQHPEAAARTPDGVFRFGVPLLHRHRPPQPSIDSALFRSATADWYTRLCVELDDLLGHSIVGLQIDNETNFFWSDRFRGAGHEEPARTSWVAYLQKRYASLGELNAAYGTSHREWSMVPTPTSRKRSARNLRRDWYDFGSASVDDFLGFLKSHLAQRGVDDERIFLFVNDSPFKVRVNGFALTDTMLLPSGGNKSRIAHYALDLYPKTTGAPSMPASEPFQAAYFCAAFARDNGGAVFGAELQAGLFALPLGLGTVVSACATDHLLTSSIAGGLKGGALYVLQGGLNLDGSPYAYQAPFDDDGAGPEKTRVIERWARFLMRDGALLQHAHPARTPIALVVDSSIAARTDDTYDAQELLTLDYPALYGWLTSSGFAVDVIDIGSEEGRAALPSYRCWVVAFPIGDSSLYARLNVEHDASVFRLGPALLGALRTSAQSFTASTARKTEFNLETRHATLPNYGASFVRTDSASGEPFAWRSTLLGRREVVGSFHGSGTVELGANVFRIFNAPKLFRMRDAHWDDATAVARLCLGRLGHKPLYSTRDARQTILFRPTRDGQHIFVFCIAHSTESAVDFHIRLAPEAFAALAIDPSAAYDIWQMDGTEPQRTQRGAELTELHAKVANACGTVLRISRCAPDNRDAG